MSRKPTGASFATPRVPRKSRSPSAKTCASLSSIPSAVATALSVTPAQATSASSSMSPEQACCPLPPLAGCSPASTSARAVSTRQAMPSPRRPCARSVTTAAPGSLRYWSFSGACSARSSSAFIDHLLCRQVVDAAEAGDEARVARHDLPEREVGELEVDGLLGETRQPGRLQCCIFFLQLESFSAHGEALQRERVGA